MIMATKWFRPLFVALLTALLCLNCSESTPTGSVGVGSETSSIVEGGEESAGDESPGLPGDVDPCPMLDCDDDDQCTQDSCKDGECLHLILQAVSCDDGNACTENETCDEEGLCVAETSKICDDGSGCTTDSCDQKTGCVYTAIPDGELCNDGDACSIADSCKNGQCIGVDKPCPEDDNPCTVLGGCEPANGECIYLDVPDFTICEDGNDCTDDDYCVEGECTSTVATVCFDGNPCTTDGCSPKGGCTFFPNGEFCDDESMCTAADTCQQGQCIGELLDCDDLNFCTNDGCDPSSGCIHEPVDLPCQDGNPCTLNDACQDGVCASGPPKPCDDNNPCTSEYCELGTGTCIYDYNDKGCNDGDICSGSDSCQNGVCQGGPPVDCDDGNDCTNEYCDFEQGCIWENVGGLPCDDGDACTLLDNCSSGICVGGGAKPCDDGNDCTDDGCAPESGCTHVFNAAPCDDANDCTLGDLCNEGACTGGQGKDCNDGNPCTDDTCVNGLGCTNTETNSPCDDGNACTTTDLCNGGACAGKTPVECDDGNLCTTDSCNPVTGCEAAPNAVACEDGDACTSDDTCSGGICVSGGPNPCDDQNACTDDICSPEDGCVHTANKENTCSDNNVCSTDDTCTLEGKCVGSPIVCNDDNPCTDDACDPVTGCTFTANALPCDDGNVCTVGDTCSLSACKPGDTPLSCDDGNGCTTDTCSATQGCKSVNNNNACDDENACTLGDTCIQGSCIAGLGSPVCEDSNQCTDDFCDPVSGCVNQNMVSFCDDGNPCTGSDYCQAGTCMAGNSICGCTQDADCAAQEDGDLCNGTLYCDQTSFPYACKVVPETVPTCDGTNDDACLENLCNPITGGCFMTAVNDNGPCEDGNACSLSDFCLNGACSAGLAKSCNDNNICTDDSCDGTTGICDHSAIDLGCDDDNLCTVGDVCVDTICEGAPLTCEDGDPCTSTNCSIGSGCTYGPLTGPSCVDGSACTEDDSCVGGGCQGSAVVCDDSNNCTDDSCNPDTGCVHTPNTNPCTDGDVCTLTDLCIGGDCLGGSTLECDDSNPCTTDSCDPQNGCINAANTSLCEDGDPCTIADACELASCISGAANPCDDNTACTVDACQPGTGCTHTDISGTCVDGVACTLDTCVPETGCVYTPNPSVCDDGVECTDNICDPFDGCVFEPNNESCATGELCSIDTCDPTEGCLSETAFNCCGNGLTEENEECDDANLEEDDGCSALCEKAFLCPDDCVEGNTVPSGVLEPVTILPEDGMAGTEFGYAVAMDDQTLVIGAPYDDANATDSGAVFVYIRQGGSWTYQAKLSAFDGSASDQFGHSVAIDEDTLVVGAMGDDTNGSNSGAAYVFVRNGFSWTLEQKLTSSDGASNDYFGWSVGVSGDLIAVGAYQDDQKGDGSGSAYIYTRETGVWTQPQKLTAFDGTAGSNFAIHLDVEGTRIAIGASHDNSTDTNSGSVYIFNLVGTVWILEQKLVPDDGGPNDYFGWSLGMVDNAIIVGAYGDGPLGTNSGSAYVFTRSDTTWTQEQKIIPADGAGGDQFGCSVDLDSGKLVVGARYDDDKGPASGSAYVFAKEEGMWVQEQKLVAANGAPDDYFGHAVAIQGGTQTIGSYGNDNLGSKSGSTLIYTIPPLCNPDNTCLCKPDFTGIDCATPQCIGQGPTACDDNNPCTADTCDETFGCTHSPVANPCDDANMCTLGDTCINGDCIGLTDLDCSDGIACTTDTCDPVLGCSSTPDNGLCESGESCITDTCDPVSGCLSSLTSDCCGNGLVEDGETCDDANSELSDGCDAQCQEETPLAFGGQVVSGSRRAFVSSVKYQGNLGGLNGADAKCQERADAANLGGYWKAWLSDATTDATDRLTHPDGPIVSVAGSNVASNWDNLVANNLSGPLETTEFGNQVSYEPAGSASGCSWADGLFFMPWTATNTDGTYTGGTCVDWTSNSSGHVGWAGLGGYSVTQWTAYCNFPCSEEHALYCFEQ